MTSTPRADRPHEYGIDMLDPAANTCCKLRPVKVIGLDTADFTGSPTRWPPA